MSRANYARYKGTPGLRRVRADPVLKAARVTCVIWRLVRANVRRQPDYRRMAHYRHPRLAPKSPKLALYLCCKGFYIPVRVLDVFTPYHKQVRVELPFVDPLRGETGVWALVSDLCDSERRSVSWTTVRTVAAQGGRA